MKLRYKASLAIFAFSFLFLALLAGGASYYSQLDAEREALLKLKVLSEELSSDLADNVSKYIAITTTLSRSPQIRDTLAKSNASLAWLAYDERQQIIAQLNDHWESLSDPRDPFVLKHTDNPVARHLIGQMQAFPGEYGEIFLTNRYGLTIAATNMLTNLAHAGKYWWKAGYDVGRGKIFIDDRGYDESVQGYVLGVVVPVMDVDKVIGILKSNINIQGAISNRLNNFSEIRGIKARLVRSSGLVIYEPGSPPLSTKVSDDLKGCISAQSTSAMVSAEKAFIAGCSPVGFTISPDQYGFGGKPASGDHKLGNAGESWTLVLTQDYNLATQHSRVVIQAILITGLLIALFASLLAWLTGSMAARPIEKLAMVARRIGEGDLDTKADASSNDEAGRLAESINQMTANLKATMASRDEISQEARLRQEAEKRLIFLSSSVEQAKEAVSITNRDGIIEYINPAFTELTGYSGAEAIGKFQSILKSGAQKKDFYESMWARLRAGDAWSGRIENKRKDGSLYPAMMTISPILNDDGEVSHFVSTQQSLKEYEELEEHLRQSQKMEAVGVLVGGIAHDFNNMLAGIIGNLYLAKRRADTPYLVSKLENIESLSFRASGMIKRLLTFARKDIIEMKPFGLTSFIKETSKLNRTTIPENVEFNMELCKREMVVNGDPTQLQQVIINLLSNAYDAVANVKNPSITLRLEEFTPDSTFSAAYPDVEGDCLAHLIVEDNGSGISDENKAHIFEPFFTTKEVGSGSGLGLAMVYGAVKSHGGAIEIDNAMERGVAFHIYLPTLDEKQAASYHSDPDQVLPGFGETILVVDDDEVVREATKEVLESIGYRVLEAIDGEDAIRQFEANREVISLIITDVVMPKIGGVKAIEQIKEIDPDVKAIYSTGYNKDQIMQGEIPTSEFPILTKPFVVEDLSRVIREQLDGKG